MPPIESNNISFITERLVRSALGKKNLREKHFVPASCFHFRKFFTVTSATDSPPRRGDDRFIVLIEHRVTANRR